MNEEDTTRLQELIERFRQGDDSARNELVECALDRLRRLTGTLLQSFPGLKAAHGVDSVLNEAWERFQRALEATRPPTVADFFRLAAHKIRQTLLDMVRKHDLHVAREGSRLAEDANATTSWGPPAGAGPAAESTWDPARLALWTEFHERVDLLPDDQREVFQLHHYAGLTQARIASLLGLPPHKVSRLWIAATERLAEGLEGLENLIVEAAGARGGRR